MASQHAFRFGVFAHNTSPRLSDLIDLGHKAESLGYSTLLMPDHLGDQFAPGLALAMVAVATRTLRLGSFVFANDFRHPVMLAKDVATLDVLSGGRFEFALGAGWMSSEYEKVGLQFDRASVRIERMEEAMRIFKGLFGSDPVSYLGKYYTVTNMNGLPKPIQRPHPPLFVGGSGKKMLSAAAREADIVGFAPRERNDGIGEHMNDTLDITDALAEATLQKVEWVRQAAGSRFDDLELNISCMVVDITRNRLEVVDQLASRYGLGREQVLESPYFLVGTVEEMCEDLLAYRKRFGITYYVVLEEYMEELAPVVARMSGGW